jgi:multidrug efflux pump subunit AcrA (membrane-fusion protein)
MKPLSTMIHMVKSSKPLHYLAVVLPLSVAIGGIALSQTGGKAPATGKQPVAPIPAPGAVAAQPPSASLSMPSALRSESPAPAAAAGNTTAARVQAAPASSRSAGAAELQAENCMVKLIQNVRVPAEIEGRLTDLKVTEGAYVQAGDLLAVIDDTQAQLTLEFKKAEEREAELNATNDVNYRDAVNSERSANAEAEAYKELRREGATPYWEMEKKILEADRAKLRIELAKSQQDIAKVQYIAKRVERQLAEHDLTRRKVLAPFSGFVESRIGQLGEWVQPGSPVMQLVQLDKLRIEGDIDALRYPGQVAVGTPAKVWIYANSDRAQADKSQAIQLDATIGFVSSEIDLNNRYRMWVEVENTRNGNNWQIKPGMEADITVYPSTSIQ